MASRPEIPVSVLHALADSPRFTDRQDLRLALASHPGTPTSVALRMLRTLDVKGLTFLSASTAIPMLIRVAAARRLEEGPTLDPPCQSQV